MNETNFDEGEKIQVFDDFYFVGKISKQEGIGRIDLRTKDPEIFEAFIEFRNEKINLFTKRKIDSDIRNSGFTYHGNTYQIVKQYWENEYIEGNWIRQRIHEVKLIGKRGVQEKVERKIIEDERGNYVFYNWEEITEDNIDFEPEENLSDKQEGYSRKFQIKFRDQP